MGVPPKGMLASCSAAKESYKEEIRRSDEIASKSKFISHFLNSSQLQYLKKTLNHFRTDTSFFFFLPLFDYGTGL